MKRNTIIYIFILIIALSTAGILTYLNVRKPYALKNENVEIWGISTKSFGISNGAIYWNHNKSWYFDQTVPVNETVLEINRKWKQEWGEFFVDMMQLAMVSEDQVRVFSPEHKFISPDCEHLVRGGAQYYASVLDFKSIFDDILIFNK